MPKLMALAGTVLLACVLLAQPVAAAPSDVTLRVTSNKSVYAAGETVQLTFELANGSGKTLRLSKVLDGNILLRAATRNGGKVALHTTTVNYDADLGTAVAANLVPVPPKGTMTSSLTSGHDSASGGQAIRIVARTKTQNIATMLPLVAPGTYRLSFVYRYGGPPGGAPSIFRGQSSIATVTFRVQ